MTIAHAITRWGWRPDRGAGPGSYLRPVPAADEQLRLARVAQRRGNLPSASSPNKQEAQQAIERLSRWRLGNRRSAAER